MQRFESTVRNETSTVRPPRLRSLAAAALSLALLCAVAAPPVRAQDAKAGATATSAADAALADGEVRKIDRSALKITLRHGPLPNLDMPPMTMVFRVQDAALLDSVKVGDKVRFKATKEGGAFVVIELRRAT
jgi:Cu/Ag efflux protein CusF